ncbi:MAG: fimbrillin family protein [Bacteroides sp.]|nr:fimbrillin family protein [Bacteroides sp.]
MKSTTKISLTALLWLSLAGCDRTDSPQPALSLEVSAEIAGAHTRATTDRDETNYDKRTNFVVDDEININKGSQPASDVVRYKKNTKGWAPVDREKQLTTNGTGEDFFASYPPEFTAILSDQTSYTNFWLSNRLTSTKKATANRVDFLFAPAAARITIVVTYTEGTTNTAKGAQIAGTNVCTESGKTNEIQLLCTGKEDTRHTYTCIINPIEVVDTSHPYTISVTSNPGGDGVADVTQSYTEKGNATGTESFKLLPGHEYQYNFTSTSELILSSVTVKDFDPTTETDVGPAT